MRHFIKEINIANVRHLKDITIFAGTEAKNIILTGVNGSGKTSVLHALMDYLKSISDGTLIDLVSHKYFKGLSVVINDYQELPRLFNEGEFLLAFYSAERSINVDIPNGVEKIDLKKRYLMEESTIGILSKYMVHLKTQQIFARDAGDERTAENIQDWFNRFENVLQKIFQDESLSLVYNYKKYNMEIAIPGHENVTFNELPAGYSAILYIVMDIMLKMEHNREEDLVAYDYDMEGIVLIDEIETHLHIELQKKVMPILTTLFPNLQFVVSTHSPFVLNSIQNTIVFDLEKKMRIDDMSAYSYEGIVEGYFEIEPYTQTIINQFNRYIELSEKDVWSKDEKIELARLFTLLKDIDGKLAPDVKDKFEEYEIKRRKLDGKV